MEKIILKPNKVSFFIMRMFIAIIIVVLLTAFLLIAPLFDNSLSGLISVRNYFIWAFVVVLLLIYFFVYFAYKKAEYILDKNKIIYNYWTIFSDNSVELPVDKITEVTMVLPFIEHLIFKTWYIKIKSAWSSESKTIFSNLKNSKDVFEAIQELMKNNWFHLTKDKLVQEAKPHPLWVLFELWGQIFSGFVFFVIIFADNLFELKSGFEDIWDNIWFVYLWAWIILLFILVIFVINYLDLKRRKYDVYTDSIFYTNWFLTKVYSFLPMEKISDVDNKQWFFSKIFWLHDIIVSSEWTNNLVVFSNMVEWETLIKNIKYLKNSITLTEKEISQDLEKTDWKKIDSVVWFVDKTDFAIDYNREFLAKYSMDLPRTIVSSLFFWVIIWTVVSIFVWNLQLSLYVFGLIFITVFIKWILDTKFYTFLIEKNTIESRYEFLTNRHKAFTIDKVSWVIFSENIIDKIFKTCSIKFYSIGSNGTIDFVNIKKTDLLYLDILSKVWIIKDENKEGLKVNFSFRNFALANIWMTIFFLILIIFAIIAFQVLNNTISWTNWLQNIVKNYSSTTQIFIQIWIFVVLVFIYLLKYFYWKVAYTDRFYRQNIYEKFFESESWIIFQEKVYSLFKNIKWITSTKYPFTDTGSITLDVAWDIILDTWNKNQNQLAFWWIKIHWVYMDNVYSLQNKLDSILTQKDISEENIDKSWESVWNSLIFDIPFLIWALVFIIYVNSLNVKPNEIFALNILSISIFIFFLIATVLLVWYIKAKYYYLQKERIMLGYGIIYKSRKTITYDRINFVEKNQWFLWKIFWNWIVQVYTIWSAMVDLVFLNTKDFKELYSKLKK